MNKSVTASGVRVIPWRLSINKEGPDEFTIHLGDSEQAQVLHMTGQQLLMLAGLMKPENIAEFNIPRAR